MQQHKKGHKFKVGHFVYFQPTGRGLEAPAGRYKIVRLLPTVDHDRQYRIKSAQEPFERVVNESQLTRVMDA